MRIQIDCHGTLCKFNENGRLHSFDGRPAYISAGGHMSWCNDGIVFKCLSHGTVTFLDEHGFPYWVNECAH